MNEFELIDWLKDFFADRVNPSVTLGIGDDMAVVKVGDTQLLFSSDMIVEDVHFRIDSLTARQIGHKAIGVCLSDCAAMASRPIAAVVSLARSKHLSDEFVCEIFVGIKELARKYSCQVAGGDLSSADKLIIDVSVIGYCEENSPVLRSGAKVGDTIYVTGKLGGSSLSHHCAFSPRIEQSIWLAQNLSLNAMIDISDGLSSDLNHICRDSLCGAEIYEDLLEQVISDDAKKLAMQTNTTALYHLLNDGEDFELLASIAERSEDLPSLPDFIVLYPVGRMVSGSDVVLIRKDGNREKIFPAGYQHFS